MDFRIPLTVHPLGFATPEEEAVFVSLPDMRAVSAMDGNDLHLSTKLLQMQREQGNDSHVRVAGVCECKGKVSHVTVSGAWSDEGVTCNGL